MSPTKPFTRGAVLAIIGIITGHRVGRFEDVLAQRLWGRP